MGTNLNDKFIIICVFNSYLLVQFLVASEVLETFS